MRLKLISVKDKNGNEKTEFMDELKADHPDMTGVWINQFWAKHFGAICFAWGDKSNKMLRTSFVTDFKETENKVCVETQNSMYEFEKL